MQVKLSRYYVDNRSKLGSWSKPSHKLIITSLWEPQIIFNCSQIYENQHCEKWSNFSKYWYLSSMHDLKFLKKMKPKFVVKYFVKNGSNKYQKIWYPPNTGKNMHNLFSVVPSSLIERIICRQAFQKR
jgi:hypothetical protein